jgi:ATP-dependent DNA helicase RecG
MPLPINISDLLHGHAVEWERLEFKAGWNPQVVLHAICAFANDFHNLGGGYIVIGVAEAGGLPVLPPVGLAPATLDVIQKELLHLGHNCLQPAYHPVSAPYVIDGRTILVIWAPGGETRPYKARASLSADKSDWAYFIRKGSSTVRARGTDERELISLAATVPFDDRVNQLARVEDLSRDLIRDFLVEVGSDLAAQADSLPLPDLARQLQVARGVPEALFPLNVGLLFFHPAPHRFFPATQIDVVWFPDGPGGDQFTEKTFQGPLHHQLRDALAYIERNFITEIVIKHPDRAEATRVNNYPLAAIEEALANAVYHRSYEEREPIEVRITREELVIVSYPGPDRSLRLADLQAGRAVSRRYRNRRIGEFLKELDLTEGRSTGIPKMLRVLRENGSPAPVFETDDDRAALVLRIPIHTEALALTIPAPGALNSSLPVTGALGVAPVTAPVTAPVAASSDKQALVGTKSGLSQDQVAILSQCLLAKSLMELLVFVGRTNRTKFRDQVVAPLIQDGLIELTIPDKPTSRLQKYRLTAKGRTLVSE